MGSCQKYELQCYSLQTLKKLFENSQSMNLKRNFHRDVIFEKFIVISAGSARHVQSLKLLEIDMKKFFGRAY